MATVSLSPSPIPSSIMSTRRVPLSANPNVANSPVRGIAALTAAASKQKRSYANIQREEAYGQAPPAKKQMLDNGSQRALRSPTKQPSRIAVARGTTRSYAAENVQQHVGQKPSEEEVDQVRKWQNHQRSRFPKFVFYFESIPDDQRVKLAKQLAQLGAVSL